MTKKDIRFLSAIAASALVLFLLFRINRVQGGYAEISYDGMKLARIPLSGQEESCYLLLGEEQMVLYKLEMGENSDWEMAAQQAAPGYQTENYNIFLCGNGEVSMIKSNCPDQICVRHKTIHTVGENIICLPHKVVIQLTGGEENELDGVAR